MDEYTYIYYIHINHVPYDDEIICLGTCKDLFDLYYFVFVDDGQAPENKPILLAWKNLVETELDIEQKSDLKNSLRQAPKVIALTYERK